MPTTNDELSPVEAALVAELRELDPDTYGNVVKLADGRFQVLADEPAVTLKELIEHRMLQRYGEFMKAGGYTAATSSDGFLALLQDPAAARRIMSHLIRVK